MRPPECALCGLEFGPEDAGGLVTFARRPEDDDWYRRAEAPGFTGHPPNVDWFCGEHIEAARALSNGTLSEALQRLRAQD